MEILSTIATVDSVADRVIGFVKNLVMEINRARNDVATLPDEISNLQEQYEKLSDRVIRVCEANADLHKVYATNPKLGEAQSKEGELEKLLTRLENSLQSDLPLLQSLKKDEQKPRSPRSKRRNIDFWVFLGKGAAEVQKRIQEVLTRIEVDCIRLDEAIAVRSFASGVRVEEGVCRVEEGVDRAGKGVGRVEEILREGLNMPDRQFSYTAGAQDSQSGQKCGGLPEYLVARQQLPNHVEKTLSEGGILGIFGMGGIGKTTFAKSIFNEISWKFEYTCFVDNVKGIQYHALDDTTRGKLHLSGRGIGGRALEWTELKGKKTLIVMDDVDSDEQLDFLPRLGDFGTGSLRIFTTRDGTLCRRRDVVSFEKLFLEPQDSRKLFCLHAFSSEDIPEELQEMTTEVEKVIEKCEGLPLSLEVIGKHLYVCGDEHNAKMWEDILDSLSIAQPVDGNKKDRLFANVKVSYDALAKDEQQMFCDIATFFFEKRLDVTLAAMSASISKRAGLCWGNLVRRCLVQERTQKESFGLSNICSLEYKQIWMHEHLRDLGKQIAGTSFLPAHRIIDKVNSKEVQVQEETKQLRSVSCSYSSNETVLEFSSLAQLTGLKYLSLGWCKYQDATQNVPRELVLLQLDGIHCGGFPSRLFHDMKNLTVLEIPVDNFDSSGSATALEGLGNLLNLMVLSLKFVSYDEGEASCPFQLPENFGGLTKLQRLTVDARYAKYWMLPKSFGQLSSLETLVFKRIAITHLPDSFGSLTSLKTLVFWECNRLTRLPDSFESLSKLEKLLFQRCRDLKVLPRTFGTSLRDLFIGGCWELKKLPVSILNLSGLRNLICPDTLLERFEGSFGNPSMLVHLESLELELLNADLLPNFSDLSSKILRSLKLSLKEQLPNLDFHPDFENFNDESDDASGSQEDPEFPDGESDDNFDDGSGAEKDPESPDGDSKNLSGDASGAEEDPEFPGGDSNNFSDDASGTEKDLEFPNGDSNNPCDDACGTTITHKLSKRLWDLSSLEGLTVHGKELASLCKNMGERVSGDRLGLELEREECPAGRSQQILSMKSLLIQRGPGVQSLPDSIGDLILLQELKISGDDLIELPDSLTKLSSLKDLKIISCGKLKTLPANIMSKLGSLEVLELVCCHKLKFLPESIGQLCVLKELRIEECQELETLPESMGHLGTLKELKIEECQLLKTLPESMGQLGSLEELSFKFCWGLKTLLETLGQIGALKELQISYCEKLKTLPESIGQLGALKGLIIEECRELKTLPETMGQLGSLEVLSIWGCHELKTLPETMGHLGALKQLYILKCEEFKSLPESMGHLSALEGLHISDCQELKTLPNTMGNLSALKDLHFSNCYKLMTLLESIGQLGSLEELSIKYCPELKTLPETMGLLSSLKHLRISNCQEMKTLPESMGHLGALKSLHIFDCQELKTLLESMGHFGSLKWLDITSSPELVTLPESMGNLPSLETVYLEYNDRLQAVPRTWGRVENPSPDQASASFSSPRARTRLELIVDLCPSLMDFVRKLSWDFRREDALGVSGTFIRRGSHDC